jgi:hypothetical protein
MLAIKRALFIASIYTSDKMKRTRNRSRNTSMISADA